VGGRLAPHTEHRSLTGSADARRGSPHVSLEETGDGLRAEPKAWWPAPGCRQCNDDVIVGPILLDPARSRESLEGRAR